MTKNRPETILRDLHESGALPDGYKYPASLDVLGPSFKSLLIGLQRGLIEALRQENENVSSGVVHPPFHVDYADASEPNALAFEYGGFAFIVITVPMMEMLWRTSERLSHAPSIAALLDVDPVNPPLIERLITALFSIQFSFLVCHEYTHHIHGHLGESSSVELRIWKEMRKSAALEAQAQEVGADTYAVYIALTNLFNGSGRDNAISVFALRNKASAAHESLLVLFVVAVGAFFCAFSRMDVDVASVYEASHPLVAVRMNYVMHSAISWCNQNCPAIETWMNPGRYQIVIAALGEALWGAADTTVPQVAFLNSAPGAEYLRQLEELRLQQFRGLEKVIAKGRRRRV